MMLNIPQLKSDIENLKKQICAGEFNPQIGAILIMELQASIIHKYKQILGSIPRLNSKTDLFMDKGADHD